MAPPNRLVSEPPANVSSDTVTSARVDRGGVAAAPSLLPPASSSALLKGAVACSSVSWASWPPAVLHESARLKGDVASSSRSSMHICTPLFPTEGAPSVRMSTVARLAQNLAVGALRGLN